MQVRAKEAAKMQASLMTSKEDAAKKEMFGRVPEIARIVRTYPMLCLIFMRIVRILICYVNLLSLLLIVDFNYSCVGYLFNWSYT